MPYWFYIFPCWVFCFGIFFFFFGHAHRMQRFWGQGSNSHHSSDPSHNSDRAWSLTHCATRELLLGGFKHCKYIWPSFSSLNMPSSLALGAFVLAILCLLCSFSRYLQAGISGHLTLRCHILRSVPPPKHSPLHRLFWFFLFFFFFSVFLPFPGPFPRHMEVPRLGVQSEL